MGRETFEQLQAAWRKAHEAEQELYYQLKYKYGQFWQAPAAKRKRLDALRVRGGKAMERVFAWLDANSPRSWRVDVPAYWVCEGLTYDDAVTADRLSVVPPTAYGCYESDSLRFAQPVEGRVSA